MTPPDPQALHTTPTPRFDSFVPQYHERNILNGHRRASDASDASPSRLRLPVSRPGSYSSTFSVPDDRMSINPAYEVEESLRSFDITSPVPSVSSSASIELGRNSPNEMDQREEEVVQPSAGKMDGLLPADDGMQALRRQLLQIKQLAISTEEKAKQMHTLMTRDYLAHKAVSTSPLSLSSGDSKSFIDEPAALDVGLAAMPIDPNNPYNVRPGDLEISYSPLAVLRDHDVEESVDEDERPSALGCIHYMRNVKVQCFDCHRWFPCRHCHDQSHNLPFPHNLRRKMTRNMLCMLCRTPQPAAETCVNCGEYAAYYYCDKCKLWDNDSNKSIYHCDDCGICRLGEGLGKDFVHCKKCNVCISISTSAAHPCVEGATEGDCPLCLDEMFASRSKVVSLPCGHYMHGQCYKELMASTYKCPVCSKSAVNMELQWRKLDDEIEAQPMPDDDEELNNILPHIEDHLSIDAGEDRETPAMQPRRPKAVWVGCNDCASRCWTPFHWLGLKCQVCGGYNTNQMAPTAVRETETERLIRQQQIHRHHDFTGNAVLLDAGIGADDHSRADSALYVPTSPSQLAVPASPGSPGSASSSMPSPRRYFVQDDEPRRPSFTSPYFSTPTLPTLPNLPEMPRLPRMPNMPNLPNIPNMPSMPNLPNMPNYLPNMPELGLPRFSPYDMFDSLSRSFSPMRYYLQGLDMQDERMRALDLHDEQLRRDANRSPTSVRSDPTPDATLSKQRNAETLTEDDPVEFWGSDGQFLSGEEEASSDSEGAVRSVDNDDDDDDDEESESDSEDVSDDGTPEDEEDLELFGHR